MSISRPQCVPESILDGIRIAQDLVQNELKCAPEKLGLGTAFVALRLFLASPNAAYR